VPQIFVFAAGTVVGFALVGAIASGGFSHHFSEEPGDVRALEVSCRFPSVGLALVAALATGSFTGGLLAWLLGSILTTVVYLLTFALEMGIAEKLQPELRD
jgi:hypothetical protein